MAIQLNEPVVLAVVGRLQDQYAEIVDAINAEVDDGFTIEAPPPEQIRGYIPGPGEFTQYPTIGIGDGPSTFEDDEGYSATGRHEILIVVYEQSDDQETLAWRLRRHQQAITRIVLDGRRLDDAAWGTGLVRIVPGRTLVDDPDNPQTWMSWTGIQIWAKRDEE